MRGLSVIAITNGRNIRFPAISKAAEQFHVSPYRILTCCFTNTPVDGVYFDFGTDVTDQEERLAYISWEKTRKTSKTRRIVHGQLKKEL